MCAWFQKLLSSGITGSEETFVLVMSIWPKIQCMNPARNLLPPSLRIHGFGNADAKTSFGVFASGASSDVRCIDQRNERHTWVRPGLGNSVCGGLGCGLQGPGVGRDGPGGLFKNLAV